MEIQERENKYYVYEHWLDNKCIYVGSGLVKNNRSNPKIKRNSKYEKLTVGRKNEITVKIVSYFNCKKEALEFEENLTLKYKEIGQAICCMKYGNKGAEVSESTRKKLSERLKKYNPSTIYGAPNKGVKMKEEQKIKISNTLLKNNEWYYKRIICIENEIEFENVYEASKYYNTDVRKIKSSILNGTVSRKLKLSFKFI